MLYRGGENVYSDVVPDFIPTAFSIANIFFHGKRRSKNSSFVETHATRIVLNVRLSLKHSQPVQSARAA